MNARPILRSLEIFLLLVFSFGWNAARATAQSTPEKTTLLTIDATAPVAPPETGYLRMGGAGAERSPGGHILSLNSRYLTMNGKPWLPVMGEFHFTRYPESYWEEEILKMKAGGVSIVATYLFWIHHEEVEGQFEWTGQRDLRRFVELCSKHGMYVYPRVGPWAHGEVRNGGLPDWVLKQGPVRVNDPVYLASVQRYYNEVGKQLKGLLWKEGGPVIGIQLENEYSNSSPNGGAAHIAKLKRMAMEAGLDVPLYSVTGWDNAVYPPREVMPVFGGYPDEFWSDSREELPADPEGVYLFNVKPSSGAAGILQGTSAKSDAVELWHYPRVTAELGGGMQVAYHRRLWIREGDSAPMALAQLGAGVNLLGYYMYQGGINPQGKLSTLQESQATGYPNDLPVMSYDFQAPLREFGQMNGSFRKLKVLNQFVEDFGSYLAPMTAALPDIAPTSVKDVTTPRVAARTQGDHGFVFINNYVRNYPLPEHKSVQVMLKLPSETITLPREPFRIASQAYFFWPVNLEMEGALLKYATAQPFAKMEAGSTEYYFFVACTGVVPEFVFRRESVVSLHTKSGVITKQGERTLVSGITPSTAVAIEFHTPAGKNVRIVLFSEEQAENAWKASFFGHEYLLLTSADVFFDEKSIHMRSRDSSAFLFSALPAFDEQVSSSAPLQKVGADGAFVRYNASVEAKTIEAKVEKVRDAALVGPVKMGRILDWRPQPVASAPDDSDFEKAGVWRVTLPKDALRGVSDVFLKINYVGDVARLYEGTRLLDDNFFNGTSWEVGLKRFGVEALWPGMDLKILPLRKDAPIYLAKEARPEFPASGQIAEVKSVVVSPEYEVKVSLVRPVAGGSTKKAKERQNTD